MGSTRAELHRLAAHVLGRRRFAVAGRFGLRASPGGMATPAFGPESEVVRIAGPNLVREVGSACHSVRLDGATLAELAAFAGADLDVDFSAGPNTPALGPTGVPVRVDAAELDAIARWFGLGWRVLDAIVADGTGWSTVQLWPEHFDAGTACELGAGAGVNLGFSAGDTFCEEPYAYVGPWDTARPGDASFWNAPFGAALPRSAAAVDGDHEDACAAFLRRGLELLGV